MRGHVEFKRVWFKASRNIKENLSRARPDPPRTGEPVAEKIKSVNKVEMAVDILVREPRIIIVSSRGKGSGD